MKASERKAIVKFWLWKRWGDLDPQTFRRLFWRSYARMFGSFVCLAFLAGNVYAAETKPAPEAPAVRVLSTNKPAVAKKPKFSLPALSAEDQKAAGKSVTAEGTILARNFFGMAVEYERDAAGHSKEVWLTFHDQVKIKGLADVSKLQAGDVVQAVYKLTKTQKIILQSVTFVRRKTQEEFLRDLNGPEPVEAVSEPADGSDKVES